MVFATNWQNNIGMEVDSDYLNAVGAALNAGTQSGTFASRPAASADNNGMHYLCTDSDAIYRSDGTTWKKIRLGAFAGTALADPPATGWTDVNISGSDVTGAAKDAQIITTPSGSGINLKLRVMTLSPASNYTATAYVAADYPKQTNPAYIAAGLVLRDSVSGKCITLSAADSSTGTANPAIYAQTFNNATSSQGTLALVDDAFDFGVALLEPPKWWRVRDDGTTRYLDYSYNGETWATVYSGSRTEFITANQIGFFVWNSATSQTMTARLRSLVVAAN